MAHACIAWAPAFAGGHAPDEPVWRSIRTQPAQSAFSATSYFAVVFAATSSAVTPGASSISLNGLAWSSRLNTARSVTIMRSEEHTSELQSLMRISYAVFCLKKKKTNITSTTIKAHKLNTLYNIRQQSN